MNPLGAKDDYNIGYNYFFQGKYKESIKFFKKESSKYNKNQIQALKFKGIAHYFLEEYDEAYNSFCQALDILDICQKHTQHAVSTAFLSERSEHVAEILCFAGITLRKFEEELQKRYCILPNHVEDMLKESKEKLEKIRDENGSQNNNSVIKKLGIVYYLLKEYNKAIEVFSNIIDPQPEDSETLDTLKSVGLIHYECKQYDKACEMFDRAIKVKENDKNEDPLPYIYKAILLAKLRCCDILVKEAYKACDKATKLAPEAYNIRFNEGMTYYFLEEYPKAIKAFKKALENEGKSKKKNIEESYEKTNEEKCKKNNIFHALSMRGLSHLKLGSHNHYKEAYKCFLQALEQNPDDIEILNLKGIVFYRLNEPTKAKEAFERALSIDPSDLFTRNNLGWLLLNFGNLDEAYSQIKDYLISYTKIQKNTKDNDFYEIEKTGEKIRFGTREFDKYARRMGWGWCLKGQIDIEKSKYIEAMESFDQAIKWDKTFSLYLLWHAYARYLRAKYNYGEKSVKYQEELITIVRDLEKVKSHENNRVDAYALYFLGICYCKMGNYLQAKEKLIDCVNLRMEKEKPVIVRKPWIIWGAVVVWEPLKVYDRLNLCKEKLAKFIPFKSSLTNTQQVANKLLGNIWTYQIKPPWYIWWWDSPTNKRFKQIIFIVIFITIFSLMAYVIWKDIKENLNQFLLAEIALIFLLISTSITRIAGKDISIEIQSPTFSAVEFYPEMPPFNLEDARPIRDISSKSSTTGDTILFFNLRDLLKK